MHPKNYHNLITGLGLAALGIFFMSAKPEPAPSFIQPNATTEPTPVIPAVPAAPEHRYIMDRFTASATGTLGLSPPVALTAEDWDFVYNNNADYPEADALYTYWLTEYDGGLPYRDFKSAYGVVNSDKNVSELRAEFAEKRRAAFSNRDMYLTYRDPLPLERSAHIAEVQMVAHPQTQELEIIYHFRNGTQLPRRIDWQEAFPSDIAFRDILVNGKIKLMQALAQKGIWV